MVGCCYCYCYHYYVRTYILQYTMLYRIAHWAIQSFRFFPPVSKFWFFVWCGERNCAVRMSTYLLEKYTAVVSLCSISYVAFVCIYIYNIYLCRNACVGVSL